MAIENVAIEIIPRIIPDYPLVVGFPYKVPM